MINSIERSDLNAVLNEAVVGLPDDGNQVRDRIVGSIYGQADLIARKVVQDESHNTIDWSGKVDRVVMSGWLGLPVMAALLAGVLWLTIVGANYPSQLLGGWLFWLQDRLTDIFVWAGAPGWLHGVVVLGAYRAMAWVVAVMLPPMAIFFPLFTLMEDLGYLPRVAFNLDYFFRKVGAHGKQSLSMCMGLGCNAAGVVACRIIDSPRERLIAILTNSFVPCNGRFPTLIALSALFMGGSAVASGGSIAAVFTVTSLVLLGVTVTLAVSWLLSRSILKGIPSFFILELPPYRKPQVGRILIRSLLDRTIFVLIRAVIVAAPAGALVWVLANTSVGGASLISYAAGWLDPAGRAMGMDGFILLAFILGWPANEIVLPVLLMSYLATGSMMEIENLAQLHSLLVAHHWTWLTALSTMLFSVLHFPCTTTLLTIFKETGRVKWTLAAVLVPLTVAVALTLGLNLLIRLWS